MHAPVREWRVHIGAHKTATTHLQETLEAIHPVLLQRGVDAITIRTLRPVARRFVSLRNWRVWAGGKILREEFRARIEPLRAGPDRVVLSEENFLGHLHHVVREKLYWQAGLRLRAVVALQAEAPLHLFLAIRRMDAFLPAAYAELLRQRPARRPFGELKPAWIAAPPRWTDLVRRIRRAAPQARLTIWRYEDYPAHRREILAKLCGTRIDDLPDLPRPETTMRPSAAAVGAAEALDPAMPLEEWRRRIAALYREAPAGAGTAYAPFGEAEAARLAAAYDADCAALAAEGLLLSCGGSDRYG